MLHFLFRQDTDFGLTLEGAIRREREKVCGVDERVVWSVPYPSLYGQHHGGNCADGQSIDVDSEKRTRNKLLLVNCATRDHTRQSMVK